MATATVSPAATELRSSPERDRLILEHWPQVKMVASYFKNRLPGSVAFDDLVSAGVIGLLAAVDHFDPSRNVLLKTYAEHKIRGAILDSIRQLDGVPHRRRPDARRREEAVHAVEQRGQRTPTEGEIAAELQLSLKEYRQWTVDLRGVSIESLDRLKNCEGIGLSRFVADDSARSPLERLLREEQKRIVAAAAARLPQPVRLVLMLYYGQEWTLREIAVLLGLHLSRISQLKIQGEEQLRRALQQRGLITTDKSSSRSESARPRRARAGTPRARGRSRGTRAGRGGRAA